MFVHVRKKQAPNVVGVRLITFSPSIHRLILFLTTYPALGAKGRRGSGGWGGESRCETECNLAKAAHHRNAMNRNKHSNQPSSSPLQEELRAQLLKDKRWQNKHKERNYPICCTARFNISLRLAFIHEVSHISDCSHSLPLLQLNNWIIYLNERKPAGN